MSNVLPLLISLAGPVVSAYVWSRVTHLSAIEKTAGAILLTLTTTKLGNVADCYMYGRAARRQGAQPVPTIAGWLPGSIDVLIKMLIKRKSEMTGASLLQTCSAQGGIVRLRVLSQTIYFTNHNQVGKHVLSSPGFLNYIKGERFKSAWSELLANGIFASDPDETWKWHRAVARPFFAKERVSDFALFNKYADHMIEIVERSAKDQSAINIEDVLGRMTLDIGSAFLFGTSVDSLAVLDSKCDDTTRQSQAVLAAFNDAQNNAMVRTVIGQPFWPLIEHITGNPQIKPMSVLGGLVDGIVHRAVLRREAGIKSGDEQTQTFLGHLMTVTTDEAILRDELLNVLIAARDTTSSLMTSTIHAFALHADVLKRAREEVLALVGHDSHPTHDDMRNMKYLRAVLNEVLRLYPSVPANIRAVTRDDVMCIDDRRIFIEQGSSVAFSIWGIHREARTWGEDVLTFDPARWLDGDKRFTRLATNPTMFQPFSGGPRICLGMQLAYAEATTTIIRMLQKFDHMELAPDCQPGITPKPLGSSVTLSYKGGLHVRFRLAQDES
ncbi:hypothetical protein E5Q_06743 [Mixia osmundae IAM 14324]|uniref:Cytochrome P450 n=1 Tax=Mixia osmundae (strain CBS 9802 / IAM 14324 / JCM 22182 / KY 12970) TaxID=764103 RepID=G7EB30_MIXOS|nr:hypothetical protein E5Q_06743 [Mixia osmundae IAM 14324]